MAKRFGMHVNTPNKIVSRVLRKFGALNITHAVYLACQCGLLPIRGAGDAAGMTQAGPSLRLLRSLVVEGFSVSFIAGRMGMGQPELSDVMARTTITVAMETRVRRVFAELAGRDPLALGVHPRGVTRARNRARAEGWEVVPVEEVRHVA
ncbi:hypothetical protein [Streptomyces sp. NPDC056169]|uniref:hypothetical protein n=1 Tax=Streptomyces sp. NPDC056169 TaxID=3345734 RepID=UPI0035E10A43